MDSHILCAHETISQLSAQASTLISVQIPLSLQNNSDTSKSSSSAGEAKRRDARRDAWICVLMTHSCNYNFQAINRVICTSSCAVCVCSLIVPMRMNGFHVGWSRFWCCTSWVFCFATRFRLMEVCISVQDGNRKEFGLWWNRIRVEWLPVSNGEKITILVAFLVCVNPYNTVRHPVWLKVTGKTGNHHIYTYIYLVFMLYLHDVHKPSHNEVIIISPCTCLREMT